ncbi:MAG: SIS domain-containing protein [Chloroflexi bacterium]|nr:SIS domain-containing protein [Chloroflexota bacterium]
MWVTQADLLVAISSSGRSNNILRAVRAASRRGCSVITLSGFDVDNPLRSLGDLNFYISSQTYGYVESAHSVLTHFLTDSATKAGLGNGK